MMNRIFAIAREESRLWLRSRLALGTLLIFALLLAATSIATSLRMSEEHRERSEQQALAEETFLSQPDRHPHRMLHYGHYVFRTPPPLAMIDPGVDAVTGQSIFLEGHRQNSAMFADTRASADLGGFEGLTAALVYQLFVPLLLIAIGHGVFIREREENTLAPLLAQGVTGNELYAGKGIALAGVALALLLPLAVVSAAAIVRGGSLLASSGVIGLYALYLLVWCGVILLVSAMVRSRALSLGILALCWLASAMIVPRMAVESASSAMPAPGKIETDLRMQAELREISDGHNAGAPQFLQLQANLLVQYDVERVEDLPVNFRGVVAEVAEADLTEVMNRFAEERMTLKRVRRDLPNLSAGFRRWWRFPQAPARCREPISRRTIDSCEKPRRCASISCRASIESMSSNSPIATTSIAASMPNPNGAPACRPNTGTSSLDFPSNPLRPMSAWLAPVRPWPCCSPGCCY